MADVKLPTHLKLFINGKWVDSKEGKTFPVINPCTGKEICQVPNASKADVDDAVAAARAALDGEWRTMGAKGRRNLLLKFADIFEKHLKDLGRLEVHNNGGPLAFQGAVIDVLPDDIRYYAGWADKIDGRVPAGVANNIHAYVQKEPIGVCGLILPWNLPLWALVTKLGPCLATGNTAVIKPAEQTPLTALKLCELIQEAGFPPGVVNVVTGFGPTGAAITSHMDVDKVAFTGSTEVGRLVMKASADSNLKRVQLELGGKSPLVVFPDANIKEAVEIAGSAVFVNNGQLCTAGSRTFVHSSVYDEFVKLAVERAKTITVGDPVTNKQGPLVDEDQFTRVLSLINKGKQENAKLECGGARHGTEGYFVQPTIFSNVTDDMTIAREEIFGPVQSILKFDNYEDVIKRANKTPYGLASGILSKDVNVIFAAANQIKAGTVWVNTYLPVFPQLEFGGYKQSGFGREGGVEGISEWTQTKTVIIGVNPKL